MEETQHEAVKDMILADALKIAIDNEKRCIRYKRIITALVCIDIVGVIACLHILL